MPNIIAMAHAVNLTFSECSILPKIVTTNENQIQ